MAADTPGAMLADTVNAVADSADTYAMVGALAAFNGSIAMPFGVVPNVELNVTVNNAPVDGETLPVAEMVPALSLPAVKDAAEHAAPAATVGAEPLDLLLATSVPAAYPASSVNCVSVISPDAALVAIGTLITPAVMSTVVPSGLTSPNAEVVAVGTLMTPDAMSIVAPSGFTTPNALVVAVLTPITLSAIVAGAVADSSPGAGATSHAPPAIGERLTTAYCVEIDVDDSPLIV